MGRDGLQVGVQIRKFVIISTRICYRSVCNHPFFVGILLLLSFLYRSSPFLFSLLVSSSPVLVCTAVLLGTLLSFGEPNFPLIEEEEEKTFAEVAELKTGSVENTISVEKDESIERVSQYTELTGDIVERTMDEGPLLDSIDTVGKLEGYGDVPHNSMPTDQNSREIEFGKLPIEVGKLEIDGEVAHCSMPIDQNSREIEFGNLPVDEVNSEFENLEIDQKVSLCDQKIQAGMDFGLSHYEIQENGLSRMSQAEYFEDYKSAEGSADAQIMDHLDSSSGSWERSDDVLDDSLSPAQDVSVSSSHEEVVDNTSSGKVQARSFEEYKSAEGSVDDQIKSQLDSSTGSWEQSDHVPEDSLSPVRKVQAAVLAQLRNQLESSLGSWNHFDVVESRSSATQKVQADNSEDYKSAEGSVEAQMTDRLESSCRAWKQFGSNHEDDGDDDDDESGSESDGDESSSPDASMTDIIPMLDELHPLLDDENPQTGDLSHQCSMARSGKSCESSIHSDYESDRKKEVGDIKSDGDDDDDDEEEENQGSIQDPENSAISWTEDDQKNLMDLGTSELERNQRLESLIARRRARRMMAERNLIDLDGMDLQFQVAPISTTRRNPFDLPHDSYDDLGLPPIPGSAPSVLLPRRNPFDLPYDSSEEKPDLMADSFQQEFMELYYQGETSTQKEAVFRRNETFSMGSSIFNFGRYEGLHTTRASRFRPYFVPERTDFDVMSYSSSLQRQSSELSESKASSAAETESTHAGRDGEEKKLGEHESAQEMELGSEIDQASVFVELGSQSSDDLQSLSDKEKDFGLHVPEIELGGDGNSPSAVSHAFETQLSAGIRMAERVNEPEAESWISDRDIVAGAVGEAMEERHSTSSSSSSTPKEYSDLKVEDVNEVQSQPDNVENVDMLVKYSLETSASDIPSEHSLAASDFNHGTEFGGDHPTQPIYDSSPQAVKKSHSSSSISSDLLMERSEIRLCQLTSVGRGLLMTDETKVQEDAGQCVPDEKQGMDGSCLASKHDDEGHGHDISDHFHFSEAPTNLEASVVPEYELHSSADSSEIELVDDKFPENKDSQHEARQIRNQEDDFGVYMEGKLDTIECEDGEASGVHDKSSEDLILTTEERDGSILEYSVLLARSELSSLTGEFSEDVRMEKEADQQFVASSANVMNHDSDMVEKLASALDESHHFRHDSAIHCPGDNSEEQESSINHSKVEEVGQVNNVDEALNIVPVDEPQENILPDQFLNDQPSFQLEEFKNKQVAELADEEHVDNNLSQEHDVFEKIPCDFTSNVREMDEDLLSELDAVGDFSVKDIGPNLDTSYPDAGFNFDVPEQLLVERHPDAGTPYFDDTLLAANFNSHTFEPVTEIRELGTAGSGEPHLDSHAGDASTGLLVLEAQSVEETDSAFERVSEGDVQKSNVTESFVDELTRELVEASSSAPEFMLEDIEPRANATQLLSLNSEPVERIESDLASEGGHKSDSNITDSGLSVLDAKVSEQDDEGFEKNVENETDTFDIGEAPQRASEAEIEVGSVEPAPRKIHRDGKERPESPVVEASSAPAIASSTQVETFGLKSESSRLDVQELHELALSEASTARSADSKNQTGSAALVESRSLLTERVGSAESDAVEASLVTSFDNEGETERVDSVESHVEESIIPSFDSEGQIEGVGSLESGPSLIDEYFKEIQGPPADGELIAPAVYPSDHLEKVGSEESESLPIDGDVNEIQKLPILGEIVPSAEYENQTETFGPVELEPLRIDREVEELQELHDQETSNAPSVEANNIPSIDSEDQIEVGFVKSVKSGISLADEDIREVQELSADGESTAPSDKFDDPLQKAVSKEPEPSPIDSDAKEMQESPVDDGDIVPSAESEDQTERSGSVEFETLHDDEASNAPSVDSKGGAERVGFVEVESLNIEGNAELIKDSPFVEANAKPSIASSIVSEHQTESAPHMEVVEAQALENKEFFSQQQSHGLMLDEDGSVATTIQSSGMETAAQESTNTFTKIPSAQCKEGEPHKPHLEFSSSESGEERNINA